MVTDRIILGSNRDHRPPPPQHAPETYAYLVEVLTDFLVTTNLLEESQDEDSLALPPINASQTRTASA